VGSGVEQLQTVAPTHTRMPVSHSPQHAHSVADGTSSQRGSRQRGARNAQWGARRQTATRRPFADTPRTAFRAPSPTVLLNGQAAQQRRRRDAPTGGDELPRRGWTHKSATE
jgi:hypothetical protein